MNKSNSTMERTSSTATDSGFWTTIELLMGAEWRERSPAEDAERAPAPRPRPRPNKARRPRPRGPSIVSLEDEIPVDMDLSSVVNGGRGTRARGPALSEQPHSLMQQLQERIREVSEEALQRRIAAREMDEMDRLKRLILSGKSPVEDCPPELKGHPVFVFWGLINKEVEKMSKARADAYYKKLRRPRRRGALDSQGTSEDLEEVDPDDETELPESSDFQRPLPREPRRTLPTGPAALKYEDEGVKELRNLTTVEELYQMADQIIGVPREAEI